ncbi:MAG: hypothetical protein N2445_04350 [Acidobacteria bacterium]|nr:hypothetical protein [Acidobacteriota bacterium]
MAINFYKNCDFEVNESILLELLKIYGEEKALPQGRGTAKLIEYKGKNYIIKKEARGGMLSFFLPDKFFLLSLFHNEIEINRLMEREGLAIPIVLRFWKKHNILNEVYTLTPYLDGSFSLKDIVLRSDIDKEKVYLAGQTVAKMHKIGVYHFDLNLGNIIFSNYNCFIIDLKNSYIYDFPLNKTLSKKNLLRIFRSYLKETTKSGKKVENCFIEHFLEGYLSERKEDWVKRISFDNISIKFRELIYKLRF